MQKERERLFPPSYLSQKLQIFLSCSFRQKPTHILTTIGWQGLCSYHDVDQSRFTLDFSEHMLVKNNVDTWTDLRALLWTRSRGRGGGDGSGASHVHSNYLVTLIPLVPLVAPLRTPNLSPQQSSFPFTSQHLSSVLLRHSATLHTLLCILKKKKSSSFVCRLTDQKSIIEVEDRDVGTYLNSATQPSVGFWYELKVVKATIETKSLAWGSLSLQM